MGLLVDSPDMPPLRQAEVPGQVPLALALIGCPDMLEQVVQSRRAKLSLTHEARAAGRSILFDFHQHGTSMSPLIQVHAQHRGVQGVPLREAIDLDLTMIGNVQPP